MSSTSCGRHCDCHDRLLTGLHCSNCDPDRRHSVVTDRQLNRIDLGGDPESYTQGGDR